MSGGDRMLHHRYGYMFAHNLAPSISQIDLTLAEFGILKDTGLAICCDLLLAARVIGFDIDFRHLVPATQRQ